MPHPEDLMSRETAQGILRQIAETQNGLGLLSTSVSNFYEAYPGLHERIKQDGGLRRTLEGAPDLEWAEGGNIRIVEAGSKPEGKGKKKGKGERGGKGEPGEKSERKRDKGAGKEGEPEAMQPELPNMSFALKDALIQFARIEGGRFHAHRLGTLFKQYPSLRDTIDSAGGLAKFCNRCGLHYDGAMIREVDARNPPNPNPN